MLPSASQWLQARSGAPAGISSGTWALETLVSTSWLIYGALHADWVVMAPEVVVLPLCASVWWMSRRHGTVAAPEGT